jgi:hypothetical protein
VIAKVFDDATRSQVSDSDRPISKESSPRGAGRAPSILPYFGIACGELDRAALNDVASRNAKTSRLAFTGDAAAKQRDATEMKRNLPEKMAPRTLGSTRSDAAGSAHGR